MRAHHLSIHHASASLLLYAHLSTYTFSTLLEADSDSALNDTTPYEANGFGFKRQRDTLGVYLEEQSRMERLFGILISIFILHDISGMAIFFSGTILCFDDERILDYIFLVFELCNFFCTLWISFEKNRLTLFISQALSLAPDRWTCNFANTRHPNAYLTALLPGHGDTACSLGKPTYYRGLTE